MKKILIFLLLSLDLYVHAHLLVVQKNKQSLFEPLSDKNIKQYNDDILNVLVRYTWPSCIAYDLSDDEKSKLLVSEQGAEQNFVRKKLQEIDKSLDVIFVPTTLYELFYINVYLNSMKNKCEKASSGEQKSYLTDPEYIDSEVANSLDAVEDILNLDEFTVKKEIKERQSKLSPIEYVKDEINELSRTCNQKLFDKKDSFGYPNVLKVHQEFVSELLFKNSFRVVADIENFIYQSSNRIKNALIKDLIQIQKDVKENRKIVENCPIFYNWMTNTSSYLSLDESLPGYSQTYGLISVIEFLKKEEYNHIIQKVIDIEYEAAKSNKGLLFRGSDLIAAKGPEESLKIIGTTQRMDATLESQGLFSMSFGVSLFAGVFFYIDAMAYAYLTDLEGYTLFVDKFAYVDNYNSNLFLIPGLTTEMALFGSGVWFHPRSKPVTLDKSKHDKPIIGIVTGGIYEEVIKDPYGIFLITRDPYRQAYLFSKYLVENAKIIGNLEARSLLEDERIALDILKNQKIHAGMNGLELLAKKYKQRKNLKTQSISKIADVLRTLNVEINQKNISNDRGLRTSDFNNNSPFIPNFEQPGFSGQENEIEIDQNDMQIKSITKLADVLKTLNIEING
jgi:hypothetical protein